MGEFSDCVQNVQLFEGGQDSRGSRNEYRDILEKLIIRELLSKYGNRIKPVEIYNDVYCYIENSDIPVNLEFLRYGFGDFQKLTVSIFGVHISYE